MSRNKSRIYRSAVFFLLLAALNVKPAFAGTPVIFTLSPSSGTSVPDSQTAFITDFSNGAGYAYIKDIYFLVSTNTAVLTNCCYLYYNQSTNSLYLRNDANTGWLGGFAPGSNKIIENSRVKLDCRTTVVSRIGPRITVRWAISFKLAYAGKTYNSYLKAVDRTNAPTGWTQKGTWTVAAPPQAGTITPVSGKGVTNVPIMFKTTFSDPAGWQALQTIYFIVNTSSTATANGFYAFYNRSANLLYLRNDNDTAWVGGRTPGSASALENSFARINCAATTVSGSGQVLTVNWSITFKSPFTGTKTTYINAANAAGLSSGWKSGGAWSFPNKPPKAENITLNCGASVPGQVFTFSSTYSDPDGWLNIGTANLLVNTTSAGKSCVYLQYDRNANMLYIRNDANTSWGIGYAPGAGNVLENAQAKLYCSRTAVSGTTTTLKVRWAIEFKPSFTGDKKTYLNVTDSAAAASGWLEAGTWSCWPSTQQCGVAGPAGGEIVSVDGTTKLIVPRDALSETTAISINRIINPKQPIPSGTKLLSLAECKPAGLVFNQEVQLVYTLPTIEIPGTPIQLGLYSSSQGKILPVGKMSPVGSDGYTVIFTVPHFSTYAALSGLLSSGAPIGGGVKIPLPDMFTGAFGHSIPLTVSPGRKGMQPELAVNYHSSNPSSWVGLGYSLNPGYIIRSTKLGPPTFNDAQDMFYLVTDAGTTELVNLTDNLYQARIESAFTKFYKQTDDSWLALGKDGSRLFFGTNNDSKEVSIAGTFCWYVNRTLDTNGNYVDVSYAKDQGKCYLSRIDYTGNANAGFAPTNTVEFYLEPREDISSSYLSGVKVATAKRLREIQAKVNSELVWRYVFEYTYSDDTQRSLLTSVTQYAADGSNLPVQRMTYQKSH